MNPPEIAYGNEKYYHSVKLYFAMDYVTADCDGRQTSINDFLARHGGGKLVFIEGEKRGGTYTALFETNEP